MIDSGESRPRAIAYRILAAALAAPPDDSLLSALSELQIDVANEDDCGRALAKLRKAAAAETAKNEQRAADDYQRLFIGLGRGEVVPYGSWHISGKMMDKPLARLRADLRRLGLRRQADAGEPEDHASALCETMAILCDEESSAESEAGALSFSRQQKMFLAHLAPWMEIFFADIAEKAESNFYRALGEFGAAFCAFERRYFNMPL